VSCLSGFNWFLLHFTGFLPGFNRFYRVSNGFHRVLPSFICFYLEFRVFMVLVTEFYWFFLGVSGSRSIFFPDLIGLHWIWWVFIRFYLVFLRFDGFSFVLLGFIGCYRVLLSCAGFYLV